MRRATGRASGDPYGLLYPRCGMDVAERTAVGLNRVGARASTLRASRPEVRLCGGAADSAVAGVATVLPILRVPRLPAQEVAPASEQVAVIDRDALIRFRRRLQWLPAQPIGCGQGGSPARHNVWRGDRSRIV